MTTSESQYAIIHVGTLGGDAWPIVERVPGGWQSGAHHYPDDVVLDVQPLNLRDYLRAEGLAEWQRKVADALGVSEGPGPGYPWHCADADEAARYASDAVQDSLDLAEADLLRNEIEAQAREQAAVEIEAAIEAHKDYIAAMAGVPRKEVALDSMVENGMRRCVRIVRGES